ncbi:LPS export ABC transporter periplasmic protein LptC [Sulfuriferula thiophila]|uniref:LPS export ABC transporter periplasmic protein LptC n=1 Tax=Sulfuriferula thiophila TaxID=1781211 RepID=UPI000F60E62A|nr:LPS export ABC transporter periplasmic protein LptC [Sulfuriferula thiophila]
MNSRPLYWFPLAIIAVLAGLSAWLQFAVNTTQPGVLGSGLHIADYMIERFMVSRTNLAGQVIYTLHADRAEHYLDDDTTQLTKPHLVANDDQQGSADIRSTRALVTAQGKQVNFIGHVVLVRDARDAQGPMTLTTEYLEAIPDQRIMRTDRPVLVQGKSIKMTAGGLELNNQTQILQLTHRVKARYEPI